MRSTFNIKPLVTAITALSVASIASAAGLSRSEQDVSAFLQDGTYAETVYTYIDADVTGKDKYGNKIKDIAESYDYFRYGVKTDINDTFSVGVLYDEPWGAAADYDNNSIFGGAPTGVANGIISDKLGDRGITDVAGFKDLVADTGIKVETGRQELQQAEAALKNNPALAPILQPKIDEGKAKLAAGQAQYESLVGLEKGLDKALSNNEGTKVEVRSESLTGLVGMKFGQNKEFQVYGGPVAQRIKADVKLRGDAYLTATGYDLNVNPDTDYGWIAGFQYSKPEIALKAALTYRSEIDHSMDVGEYMPLLALTGEQPKQVNKMEVTTPESVNFDFQTGINPTTLE